MSDFIPKEYKTEQISVRFEMEKLELINKLSGKHNLSRSDFINQCIDYAIKNMPEIKNNEQ